MSILPNYNSPKHALGVIVISSYLMSILPNSEGVWRVVKVATKSDCHTIAATKQIYSIRHKFITRSRKLVSIIIL